MNLVLASVSIFESSHQPCLKLLYFHSISRKCLLDYSETVLSHLLTSIRLNFDYSKQACLDLDRREIKGSKA